MHKTTTTSRTPPRLSRYRKGGVERIGWPSIRMLPPLGARHLDFYLDPERLPDDYTYYKRQVGGHNHMFHLKKKLEVQAELPAPAAAEGVQSTR